MADLIENEPCYIYHVRDYQEHSQIIEALSLNYGALTIMAQGSKRANSPTKGLFQPFIPLKLSLKKSRSELYFLTGYEHAGNGFDFKMPYYFCASYINELLHHLYHNKDSDVALFGSYIETLEAIRDKNGIESHLRNFELTLLRSLGYSLSNCDDEGALLSFKDKYRFCFGLGFVKYDEKLLSYVTSQYKRASSYTSSSYANGSSSCNSEEDDGMLFSKSKVRGRRLESNVSNRSYGVSHMGFESFQYHNNFDPEQGELLKKYSDYLQDFLGPILNGAQIRDIIERAFALPDAARNAKLLTSSIINKLLNGREVKSRRLYREYVELKIKQKAQIQEQAKDANQTSASQEDKPLSNNQVQDSNVTVSAPVPVPGSNNVFDGALQETNVNTPEAYLNYALQSRAQANNSFVADAMNQDVSQSINGTQPVEVKAPYKRYVAQFAVKAEQASNDYEDIPEFNAVSENNFTVENSNELLINAIATTSDSTAKLETSYQDEQSNLSDFNLDKAAVAKAYDLSVSAQEPELSLHCETQSLEGNNSTVSPAPDTNAINSISEVAAIDTCSQTNKEEANQHKPIQDAIEQNTNLAPQETNEQELDTINANAKVEAKVESKGSSKSTSKSKTDNADQQLQGQDSNDALLETKGAEPELVSPELQYSNKRNASANTKVNAKAKVESKSSSKSAYKSKAKSANQELQASNSSNSKLEATELNDTANANTKVKAKAKVESKGVSNSKAKNADQELQASNSDDSKLETTELNDTAKANTKVKAKAKVESKSSSKSASKSKANGADQEIQASNSGDSKLESPELNDTANANTKVKAKAKVEFNSSSKSADQELQASNSGDSKIETTELNGTTKANTKVKAKGDSKDSSQRSSNSKANNEDQQLKAQDSNEALLETKGAEPELVSTELQDTNKVNAKVKAKAKVESNSSSKSASKSKAKSANQELQASNSGDSKLETTELNDTANANTKVKAKDKVESKGSTKSASKSNAHTEIKDTTKANTKVKAKANTEPKDSTKVKSKDAGESSSASKVLKRSLAKGKIKGPNGLLVAESAEDLLLGKSKNKTLLSDPKSSKHKGKAKVKRNLKDDTAVSNKSGKDKVESQYGVLLQSWLFDLGAGD